MAAPPLLVPPPPVDILQNTTDLLASNIRLPRVPVRSAAYRDDEGDNESFDNESFDESFDNTDDDNDGFEYDPYDNAPAGRHGLLDGL